MHRPPPDPPPCSGRQSPGTAATRTASPATRDVAPGRGGGGEGSVQFFVGCGGQHPQWLPPAGFFLRQKDGWGGVRGRTPRGPQRPFILGKWPLARRATPPPSGSPGPQFKNAKTVNSTPNTKDRTKIPNPHMWWVGGDCLFCAIVVGNGRPPTTSMVFGGFAIASNTQSTCDLPHLADAMSLTQRPDRNTENTEGHARTATESHRPKLTEIAPGTRSRA